MPIYHHPAHLHKPVLYRPQPVDLEPDITGELERLTGMLPDKLLPRAVELALIVGAAT
jgi:hypothetical protein